MNLIPQAVRNFAASARLKAALIADFIYPMPVVPTGGRKYHTGGVVSLREAAKTFDAGPLVSGPEALVPHPSPAPHNVVNITVPADLKSSGALAKTIAKAGKRVVAYTPPAGKIDINAAAALFNLKVSTFALYRKQGKIRIRAEQHGLRVVYDKAAATAAAAKFIEAKTKRVAAARKKGGATRAANFAAA